jgi:TRAP-type uncharacterized transport system fused permease subunit
MPTPSAYILAAMLIGPLMAQLKIPALGGHMFLLYFAVMSAITPPVAVAAYAASSIADANPLKIAGLAVKFAAAAFIVPFAFVYQPGLLLQSDVTTIIGALFATGTGVVLLAMAAEGHWRRPLPAWTRLGLGIAAICFMSVWVEALAAGAALVSVLWLLPKSGLRAA